MVIFLSVIVGVIVGMVIVGVSNEKGLNEAKDSAKEYYRKELISEGKRMHRINMSHDREAEEYAQNEHHRGYKMGWYEGFETGKAEGIKLGKIKTYRKPTDWDYGLED